MILDLFSAAELKALARARRIEVRGQRDRPSMERTIKAHFFDSPEGSALAKPPSPVARTVLEILRAAGQARALEWIFEQPRIQAALATQVGRTDRRDLWAIVRDELALTGVVVIDRVREAFWAPNTRERWRGAVLLLPRQFHSLFPLSPLEGVDAGEPDARYDTLGLTRWILLSLLLDDGTLPTGRDPQAALGEAIAAQVVYDQNGLSLRETGRLVTGCAELCQRAFERWFSSHRTRFEPILTQASRVPSPRWIDGQILAEAASEVTGQPADDLARVVEEELAPATIIQTKSAGRTTLVRLAPHRHPGLDLTHLFHDEGLGEPSVQHATVRAKSLEVGLLRVDPRLLFRLMLLGNLTRVARKRGVFRPAVARLTRLLQAGVDLSELQVGDDGPFDSAIAQCQREYGKIVFHDGWRVARIRDPVAETVVSQVMPSGTSIAIGDGYWAIRRDVVSAFVDAVSKAG